MNTPIAYIAHDVIDQKKWDLAIEKAENSRIYATSAFLNYMSCNSWDALVAGDYEYVMPLPHRKKYGFQYIFVPAFTQQLGIFSSCHINNELVSAFVRAIPGKFKYCEIALNSGNSSVEYPAFCRKNYLLPLDKPYKDLQKAYSRSAKRNIKKAIQAGVSIEEKGSPETTIELHQERFKNKIGATNNDYKNLKNLLLLLSATERCISLTAKKNDRVIATSTYVIFKDRIIFLLNGNTHESLEIGATHLLKDYLINKFSNSGYILDFEGSDFPSFARFYEQFGSRQIETYQHLIMNRLPIPFKWLKASSVSL